MACNGYTPLPVRTGYERILAHRTDDLFAKTADEDGVVEKITDGIMSVRYKSGKVANYEIGRRFGKKGGDMLAHNVTTQLKEGAKFKKADILVYNTAYFAVDKLDPTQVIYKPGVMATVALMELTDTFEDSCAISADFAKKMQMEQTHIRTIKVSFEQEVRNLLAIGQAVDFESILCTIQNASKGNKELFDKEALQTLEKISALTPKAKTVGTIERIEAYYTGEINDMSDSLQHLVEVSDRNMIKRQKAKGKPAATGQVNVGHRIDGIPMDQDQVAIRVFITGPVSMGVGDKGVFGNQLKTIVARVFTEMNETKDGRKLDAIFGYQSIANRITLSPELTGTLNSLLIKVGQRAVAAYRGKKG